MVLVFVIFFLMFICIFCCLLFFYFTVLVTRGHPLLMQMPVNATLVPSWSQLPFMLLSCCSADWNSRRQRSFVIVDRVEKLKCMALNSRSAFWCFQFYRSTVLECSGKKILGNTLSHKGPFMFPFLFISWSS